MLWETCGHQGIVLALIFWQWCSENCLEVTEMWSRTLYSTCWALVRHGQVIECKSICAWWNALAAVKWSWSKVLYWSTTQGSAHCKHWAGALTGDLSWLIWRSSAGMSIQVTQNPFAKSQVASAANWNECSWSKNAVDGKCTTVVCCGECRAMQSRAHIG